MKVGFNENVRREIELPLHVVEEVTIGYLRRLRLEQNLGSVGDWLEYHKSVQFVCESEASPHHGRIATIYIRQATPVDIATLSIEKYIGELRVARSKAR